MLDSNPYAHPSDLLCGLPPFDRIREEHHLPALVAGIAEQRAEIDAITADTREATFANTLEALERSGALLRRAAATFFNLVSSHSTPTLREVEATIAPQLAAHADSIALDPALFARVDALHSRRDSLGLDAQALRLLERHHTDMVRAGAGLSSTDQDALRAINTELSQLTTAFGNHLLVESGDLAVHVSDEDELAGLSAGERSAAAHAARSRGVAGWLLPLALPTGQPVLASLDHRGLRERVHTASTSRGLRGGEHDTRALVVRIAALRADRAALLGAATHAEYVIADSTAGSVETVTALLASLVPSAVANANAEAQVLARVLEEAGQSGPLRPWDWAWTAQRERSRRFDLDSAQLRPYFELDAVITRGVFAAASALYGLRFTERSDLPVYHPDVRVWEVREEDGSLLGLFLGDYLARESKRGGAWMNTFVDQSHLLAARPVVVNTLNIPAPSPGEPVLLTPEEVETAFHEFGHALHGLFSDVRYPLLSGTNVPRDFVEYPSQVNEMWAFDPALLAQYARHHVTGVALDPTVVAALLASRRAGQGFATLEILAAMLLDQAWHTLAPGEEVAASDVESFEAGALARAGVASELVPPRYRSSYFNHAFSGGYSAAYYSYLWSEVLDTDTVEWFHEHGGLRRSSGDAFRGALLSRGGAVDPMAAYAAFRGRGPRVEPLLERRGLSATGS